MELIKGANNNVLVITRKELKYYLDESTEMFLQGKARLMFPVESNGIDEIMVTLE